MDIWDENGWMVPCHDGYLEFPRQDSSGIAVTVWNHMVSVKPHRHNFLEFALITKGCCIHVYKGVQVPLIPGDVFLIEPGEEHSYEIQAPIELINCQFFSEELSRECNEMLEGVKQRNDIVYEKREIQNRWNELIRGLSDSEEDWIYQSRQSNLNRQGIIHLNMKERSVIEYLMNSMMEEQENREEGMEQIKMACLQMILVKFRRIQRRQFEQSSHHKDCRKEKIYEILAYMETHIAEELDFNQMADSAYWSVGYFRSVFKDVTGLTPTEYLNRLRILKSLEYMQKESLNVSEAAERVGYYDPAYFSRLFKKIMGYSPRYFKKIQD